MTVAGFKQLKEKSKIIKRKKKTKNKFVKIRTAVGHGNPD